MGKSTISMAMFNSYDAMLVITRGYGIVNGYSLCPCRLDLEGAWHVTDLVAKCHLHAECLADLFTKNCWFWDSE